MDNDQEEYSGWGGSAIIGWLSILVMSFPTAVVLYLNYKNVIAEQFFDKLMIGIMVVGGLIWIWIVVRAVLSDNKAGNFYIAGFPLSIWYPVGYVAGVLLGGSILGIGTMIVWSIIKLIIIICQALLGMEVMTFYSE